MDCTFCSKMLRTDLFKTVDRASTRFIAVRDTLTKPSANIDALVIDTIHCRQGRLGIGYHFLIITNGDIQLCRDVATVGSHSRDYDDRSVAIGIVGGTDEEGVRLNTRNPEQLEALQDLTEFLHQMYPDTEVHDRPAGNNCHP